MNPNRAPEKLFLDIGDHDEDRHTVGSAVRSFRVGGQLPGIVVEKLF